MLKKHFPIFTHHPELVYLDSAATAQKPQSVITAEKTFYEQHYATVHRGIYRLSQESTSLYESIREKTRAFINAKSAHEIIFTKGTTESINLLAHSFGTTLQPSDEIIITIAEHHANIIPWQEVCKKTGAKLMAIPLLENGRFDFDAYQKVLNAKTKLVAVAHISNVLGTIYPVEKIIAAAHSNNTLVLLDGAQAVPHLPVDMQALDCDFYAFSAHKCYGPTGVGVLYGKEKYLEKLPPYQTGGQMIQQVTIEKTEFAALPAKFEAGTPNIAGIVGWGASIDFIQHTGFDTIAAHEEKLMRDLMPKLRAFPGIKIYGDVDPKIGVISFTLDCAHPHDIATILDQSNIAVRAGHHCAMPLMQFLKVPALTRVSLGIYNTEKDHEALIAGLLTVRKLFAQ